MTLHVGLKSCSPRAQLLFRVAVVPYLNRNRRTLYVSYLEFFEKRPELLLYRFTPLEMLRLIDQLRARRVIDYVFGTGIGRRCIQVSATGGGC
jgi:hypothetical protein